MTAPGERELAGGFCVGFWGGRNSPFCCWLSLPCAAVPPHFFGLAQRNGVEPQRKALGWWRPREVSGPTRLSHSRGSCHSAAKVSASRTDWITRPRGEGFGLAENWRLKVFCPAFLQKSGRGPGAAPLAARRSARNSPCAHKAQEGVKGGTLAGGSPFAGGLSRPQPLRHRGAGGERREGSSRTPTPTAGGEPPVCRVIYCEIISRSGGGRWNAVGSAETAAAGRRGRRPLQGGCGAVGPPFTLIEYKTPPIRAAFLLVPAQIQTTGPEGPAVCKKRGENVWKRSEKYLIQYMSLVSTSSTST